MTPARFGLFPFRSPLLRESLLLSSPWGTQMFQFPQFPLLALCIQARVTPHDGCRVSPFGHPRIEARSAAPRGLSQPPTSFIGFRRQGIHRWLFIAWRTNIRCSCSLWNSQRAPRRPAHRAGLEGAPEGAPGKRNRDVRLELCRTRRLRLLRGIAYDRCGQGKSRITSDRQRVLLRNGEVSDSLERR